MNTPPKGWSDSWDCAICGQLTYFVKDVPYVNGVEAEVCDCFVNFNPFEEEEEGEQ